MIIPVMDRGWKWCKIRAKPTYTEWLHAEKVLARAALSRWYVNLSDYEGAAEQ